MKKLIWLCAICLSIFIQSSAMAMERDDEKENHFKSTRVLSSPQAKDDDYLEYNSIIKLLKKQINNIRIISHLPNIRHNAQLALSLQPEHLKNAPDAPPLEYYARFGTGKSEKAFLKLVSQARRVIQKNPRRYLIQKKRTRFVNRTERRRNILRKRASDREDRERKSYIVAALILTPPHMEPRLFKKELKTIYPL